MSDLNTKYRPKSFDEVIGQEAIVKSIKGVLKDDKVRAFILVGPAGVGKTSIARIIAKHKGCKKHNIIEIDAATNTGIDQMRAVTENLSYAPLGGGGKAIIVDEAGSLSKAAWTSLLKPIEEPPPNVYWMLCTTEAVKIPAAIKTRCAYYQLEQVDSETIYNSLCKIADQEGIPTLSEVFELVAEKCQGSPRQAITWLSQCANCKTRAEAAKLIKSASEEGGLIEFCQALRKGGLSWQQAMKLIEPLKAENSESVRLRVVDYFTKVVMDCKSDDKAQMGLAVLDAFSEPYPSGSGIYPVILSLGRILF